MRTVWLAERLDGVLSKGCQGAQVCLVRRWSTHPFVTGSTNDRASRYLTCLRRTLLAPERSLPTTWAAVEEAALVVAVALESQEEGIERASGMPD